MCQPGADAGKQGAGEDDAEQGRQIDEAQTPLGQAGMAPAGVEVAEAARQRDGDAAGGGGRDGVAHRHAVPAEVRHCQGAPADAKQRRHPADDGAGDAGADRTRQMAFRLGSEVEPHLHGHGPGEAADDDVEGAGAEQVGRHAAEPGADQHADRQPTDDQPVDGARLFMHPQRAEAGEDHGGQRGAEREMGDDIGGDPLGMVGEDQHRHYDEPPPDPEQPRQYAREGPQQQITHKQHRMSFPSGVTVRFWQSTPEKKDGQEAISLLCRLMQGNGTVHHLVEGQHGATEQGRRHPLLQPVEAAQPMMLARLPVDEDARAVEQRHQQQVFHPGGIDQPAAVDGGHQRQQQVTLALVRLALIGLPAQRQLEPIGAGEDIRHQGRRGGDVDQRQVGAALEIDDDEEDLHQTGGAPERHLGRAVLVLLGKPGREDPGLASDVGHFRRQHCPAQQGADHRDHQADVDEPGAPGADHGLQDHGGGRILEGRQLRLAHHAKGEQGHHHIERQGAEQRQHGGTAHVLAMTGTGGDHHGPLDADEDPERHLHGGLDLIHHGSQLHVALSPDIQGEGVHVEGEQDGDTEHDEWHHLGDGGDYVHQGGDLDPAQHQGMHRPDEQGGERDGHRRVAVTEDDVVGGIEEVAQRAEHHDGVGDVGQQLAEPVTPGGVEADEVAEARLGITEDTAVEIRAAHGEILVDQREADHAKTGDGPTQGDGPGAGMSGDILWQTEDPGADHGADHQRDEGAKP